MKYLLIIEPNTVLARVYTQALTHQGWEVAHASGAQAAIQAADQQQPDVIILELQLPRHNGVEFLHELRSYPEWQAIPVIVHTTLPPTKLQATRAALQDDLGVCQCLYKPTTPLAELIRAVRQQLTVAITP